MKEVKQVGPAPQKKKPNILVRFLAFLVTLALMVGAVFLVVNRDRLNLDTLKRYITYHSLERNDSGQAESFQFDGGSSNSFATVGGDLLVCSTSGIRLYSGSGKVYVDETISLNNPVVEAAGKTALVYDAGGQNLFVYADKELVFSQTLEAENALLAASINQNGFLAVVAQESGYKGAVTVYNNSYEAVLEVSLSSRFVMDAAVSPDNRAVAILTVGLEDGIFDSRVDLYNLDHSSDDPNPDSSCSLGNIVVLDLRWNTEGIWALGENGVCLVGSDGTLTGSYDYTGRYLKNFSLDGDGTAVMLLGKYRAGSAATLTVVATDGAVRASLPVDEQVLSLSAAGRYIAVLTADRLDIYNQDLEIYRTLEGTQSARRIIQRADGSVMLIGTDTARLYVPQ